MRKESSWRGTMPNLRDWKRQGKWCCDINRGQGLRLTRRNRRNRNVPYPANPNGAMGDVAGICDATGRVFGLMPHPERFVDPTQHPRWTREPRREAGDGLRVFQNAVRYFL